MEKLNHPLILVLLFPIVLMSCKKENEIRETSSVFLLESPEINADNLLPVDYTCDGESASLPLEWSGYPEETQSFALIMHHEASPSDIHWYWVLYHIPATVQSLAKNASGIGTLGNNSVNGKTEYAPPCSQGPGEKTYVYTIYALSESLILSVIPSAVSLDVLLDAMKDIILDSATLQVVYARDI